jgi:hypothetical protein
VRNIAFCGVVMQFGRNSTTLGRNILLPSSGPRSKPRKYPAIVFLAAHALLGLIFDPEDGGSVFFPNVGELLAD